MSKPTKPTFDDLGRRILAALVSYQSGYAGVDSTLKKARNRPIDKTWSQLGEMLLAYLVNETSEPGSGGEALQRVYKKFLQ